MQKNTLQNIKTKLASAKRDQTNTDPQIIRRINVTLIHSLEVLINELEGNANDEGAKDVREDALDAIRFNFANHHSQDFLNHYTEGHLERRKDFAAQEEIYRKSFGKIKARTGIYGTTMEHYKWDLTKAWFKSDNDTFFKLYGFNFVPDSLLQETYQLFDASIDMMQRGRERQLWQEVERGQLNFTSATKMRSCESSDLLQPQDQVTRGLIKKMDQMNTLSANSNPLIKRATD